MGNGALGLGSEHWVACRLWCVGRQWQPGVDGMGVRGVAVGGVVIAVGFVGY